jgi:hypothetical protein
VGSNQIHNKFLLKRSSPLFTHHDRLAFAMAGTEAYHYLNSYPQ